jgi:VWFA-related protein
MFRLAFVIVAIGLVTGAAAQSRDRIAYVSVIDAKTFAPVPDVDAQSIAIREDGTRREITRVEKASSPFPIAIVVDNSEAMSPAIADLRKALASFLKIVEGIGPIAIFTVGDRPTILQEYTTSHPTLLDAAARLFHAPGSGATLLDTLTDVSRGLSRREADRAAMVVVTGEYTEFGNLHYAQVLDRLRDSEVMMYAVVLVNPKGSMATDEARNRATVLDRGPRESGGMRIDVLTTMSFEPQLKVFGEMLKSQYRVTYARPDTLIKPERVQISAARPGLEAYGAPARGQGSK